MKRRVHAQVLLSLLAIAVLVASSSPLPTSAGSPKQQGDPGSSATPSGEVAIYNETPRQEEGRGATSEDILLIQTSDPWERSDHYVGANWYDGITSDTEVLDAIGYSYRVATWDDIDSGAVNIFAYPVVLIVNDQVQAFYDNYASRVAAFESYVSNGHTLLFFAASDGWAGGTLNADLPGGVQVTTPWYEGNNFVAAASHPIVTAQLSDGQALGNADLYSNYCSHGYFGNLPVGTTVILRESNNLPTLIEYPLGNGRVIASTQTWEHSWSYHTGADGYGTFARKALDDVFLYALSGGTVPADVNAELRIEDAPDWLTVNKSGGSHVDVVAAVSGYSSYAVELTLQVPSDMFGSPNKTFTRYRPGDPVYGQENQYTNLGSGRYRVSTSLEPLAGQYYREVIWRFYVPDGASPQENIELTATLVVPGHTVHSPTSTAKMNIVDYARSLIVTNRKLLFDKYQSNPTQNEVSPLLEQVYIQAWVFDGEVFYVDLYSDAARDWNQAVDYGSESSANTVATAIDGLVEGWYERLTRRPHWWETIRPEFLLIVGGDEVIPFYRVDDRSYGDDEHTYVHIDNNDPVGRVPQEHYLLSDNHYADVGGGKGDWEKGDLELSTGRIIGHSAAAMRAFVENGALKTPALERAVMASRSAAHNLDTVRDRLNSRSVTIYGENNPDLTENDTWTRAQWLAALEQEYQVLAYQGHGAYDGWYGTDHWGQGVTAADQPAGQIAQENPLFAVEACNFAIPTDLNGATWNPEVNDNISYKLISLGAAGILGSMGIDTTAGGNRIAYGERLHNDYFKYLIDKEGGFGLIPASEYSEYFGTALLKAKQHYPGSGLFGSFNETDKKTMMEYVYYGLPWTFLATPDNAAQAAPVQVDAEGVADGYSDTLDTPVTEALDTYSRLVTVEVTSYSFTPVSEFELLTIPGSDVLYSVHEPVLPVLYTRFSLPPGSTVTGLDLVSEHSTPLNAHNIPAAEPVTEYNGSDGFTSVMNVSGPYPAGARYGYSTRDFKDRLEVQIAVVPARFDVDTQQLTLYDITQLRIHYNAPVPVAFDFAKMDVRQVAVGRQVTTMAKVDNVSAGDVSLIARVNVYDAAGTLLTTASSSSFVVPAGDSHVVGVPWTTALQPGNLGVGVVLEQSGVVQGATSTLVATQAGSLSGVSVPSLVGYSDYGIFGLSFDNYLAQSVEATAKLHVYNSAGVKVVSLFERVFTVNAGATGGTSWSWTPAGLPTGDYVVRAVVQVGNEVYSSAAYPMTVQALPRIYLPVVTRKVSFRYPTWHAGSGIAGRTLYGLAVSPSDCNRVYAGTDTGLYRSSDGGSSWSTSGLNSLLAAAQPQSTIPAFMRDPDVVASPSLVAAVAVEPANGQVVYAATWGGGVYKSSDGGISWVASNNGLGDLWLYALAIDPANGSVIYAGGASGGVFKSVNGGANWTAANNGLGNTEIRALGIDPANSSVIYAGTQAGIYKSTDGGASWSTTGSVGAGDPWAIVIDPWNGQTVYAALGGGGVYKSNNGGASWTASNAGLGDLNLRALLLDATNSQVLYTGSNGGGVYRSSNGAGAWSAMNSGLGNWTVKSMSFQPACGRIHAGTANGAWWYGP
ncbi:MAG: hypothetical protein JXA93_21755 [Anaerolineae bacterium]|nr:hypothetical protein [Anaerolineae bacterium]